MANGYFERGEVYWVRMDTGFGYEQGVGRPGVVLSCDKQNTTAGQITVAFCSKQPQKSWCAVTEATGQTSYIICSQINTVDKTRLGKCIGMLNSTELKELDDVLEEYFDLGYVDDTAIKEKESEIADLKLVIEEAKTEAAGVRVEVAKRDEEIAALKMEIEMWQKCYGRCMDMLVDVKVNADVQRRTAAPVAPVVGTAAALILEPPVEEPKQPEPPVDPVVEEQPEKLDINSCTATALKKIGFSLALARKIVEGRPFSSVEDIKRVNGLKSSMFKILEPKLCCVPVKPVVEEAPPVEEVPEPVVKQEPDPGFEKLNINTATAKELHEICGFSSTSAYSITGYRNKNGLFQSIEDLLKVKHVSKVGFERCKHLLEV